MADKRERQAPGKKLKPLYVRLPISLVLALDREAKEKGTTMANQLARILRMRYRAKGVK